MSWDEEETTTEVAEHCVAQWERHGLASHRREQLLLLLVELGIGEDAIVPQRVERPDLVRDAAAAAAAAAIDDDLQVEKTAQNFQKSASKAGKVARSGWGPPHIHGGGVVCGRRSVCVCVWVWVGGWLCGGGHGGRNAADSWNGTAVDRDEMRRPKWQWRRSSHAENATERHATIETGTHVLLVTGKAVDGVLTVVHDRAEVSGRRVRILAKDVDYVVDHCRVLAAG